MPDRTLRELLANGRGSCSAGEDVSVLQRLVDLVRKLPFDLHDCQLDALEAALTGSDFVVRMGTGWGKTLTYLLYVLALRAPAVLITPLVALREDQLRELNEWGRRLGFEYDVAVARPADAELDSDAEASEDEDEEEVAALEPVPGKSDPLPTKGRFDPEHGWVCGVCDGCKRREGVIPGGKGRKKACSAKKQLERAAAAALELVDAEARRALLDDEPRLGLEEKREVAPGRPQGLAPARGPDPRVVRVAGPEDVQVPMSSRGRFRLENRTHHRTPRGTRSCPARGTPSRSRRTGRRARGTRRARPWLRPLAPAGTSGPARP